MSKWFLIGCAGLAGLVIFIGLLIGLTVMGTYNSLVALDQNVQAQWAQVENVYQRRLDLVPNLVETVKGAANFEKSTLIAVTEARARVAQVTRPASNEPAGGQAATPATGPQAAGILNDPAKFSQFQQAQDGLGSALSRLLVVVERYPELKANQNFLALQTQLEGTENRIAVARMDFNNAAQAFNTKRMRFPTNVIAGFFGGRFNEKSYFKAQAGAETAPKVKF